MKQSVFTILADSNISHIKDYFNEQTLNLDLDEKLNVIMMEGRDITPEALASHQPQVLLVRSVTQVNQALLADNHSIRFVGSATIGTNHIDQTYLSARGIHFSNASGCSKQSVAQYVITAILTLMPCSVLKHTSQKNLLKDRDTTEQSILKNLDNNIPLTLGIIGLGNIGSSLAKYANDLGWQILGYDPFLEHSQLNNATFEEVMSQSDVISLHVPLTKTKQSEYPTYHLIDEEALTMMKPDAMLINSARGQVIKESALLVDIETTGRKVVLDVFEHEPVVSLELLNKLTIATPHIAGYTLEGKLRGTQMVYEAFCHNFGLSVKQQINNLLPTNPYHWKTLISDIHNGKLDKLSDFYHIEQDNLLLRQAINHLKQQVSGKDFDTLRKHYALRREWLG